MWQIHSTPAPKVISASPLITCRLTNAQSSFIIVSELVTVTTIGDLGSVRVDGFSKRAGMAYIALGVVAVIIAGFFDVAALKGWRYAKQIIGLATILVWGYACWQLLCTSPRFSLPAPLTWLGWLLLVMSVLLVIYSLFIDIPFHQTYALSGVGDKLITTGTYALCRHPGVLWTALFFVALFLVSRAQLFLLAGPVWLLMDVLHVWIQDVYFFPRMFPGYRQYQRETPMLLPTPRDMVRCWRTLPVPLRRHTEMEEESHDL
jgi:protein-S-isoprenylcysteine O-methyltransferase Ste14